MGKRIPAFWLQLGIALATACNGKGIVVDPTSECRFESAGDGAHCENATAYADAQVTGTTFEGCLPACHARNDCGGVVDYWIGPTAFESALHLSTCDAPTLAGASLPGLSRYYRKVCDHPG